MKIIGNRSYGSRTFLRSDDPVNVEVRDNYIEGATKPFDLAPGSTGRFENNTIVGDPKLHRSFDHTSPGWRRPHGPPLPSYCPECKNIFPSRNYVFAGPYFYCWGNTEECPACGYAKAELSKGIFDLAGETAKILLAPDITKEMLQRLSALGSEVLYGKLKPHEAVAAAEAIHPVFGSVLKKWGGLAIGGMLLLFMLVDRAETLWSFAEHISDNAVAIQHVLEFTFEQLSVGGILGGEESHGPTSNFGGDQGGTPPNEEAVPADLPQNVPVPTAKPSN